jgi:transcriptional regulator with GAF, ATPase, and Fis domain/tetratricopeptide (TPR) repeat protein
MKLSDLSNSQWQFLTLLETFSGPVSIEVIKSLSPLSNREVIELIRNLTSKAWLIQTYDNLVSLSYDVPKTVIRRLSKMNSLDRLNEVLEQITDFNLCDQISPEILFDLFNKSGRTKDAALFAYHSAIKDIESGNLVSAMNHHFKATSHLMKLLGDPECDRLFISAALSLSDLLINVRKPREEVLNILQQAREISLRLGDKRQLALIDLHKGRIYHILLNKLDNALDFFTSGLKAVEEIDDEDIRAQSSEFFGIYCAIQGKLKEAIKHFDQAMSAKTCREGEVINYHIPAYLGFCAAFTGQYHLAIGVLNSNWHRAQLNSHNQAARFLQGQLGSTLLIAGKKREALSLLHMVEEESIAHNDIWSLVYAQRAIAYYYFIEGRTHESYNMLRKCLGEACRLGLWKPYTSLPWILELLFGYYRRGYEPIPEYDFEKELEFASKDVSTLLRGTAFRIRAKLAKMKGESPAKIKKLLNNSEADLKSAEALVELGKTRIELALLSLHEGNQEETQDLALLAWEGLSGYGYEFFPNELKLLIESSNSLTKDQDKKENLLKRYMEMIEELIPSEDLDVLLSRLVSAVSRFFGAERGAIFWFDDNKLKQGPRLRTTYNLTKEEVGIDEFRSNLDYVIKAHKNNQPIITRLTNATCGIRSSSVISILCLPFFYEDQVRGVLYHENIYGKGVFELLDESMLKRVAQNMSTYIVRILKYSKQVEDKSLSALRETTINEEFGNKEIISQSRVMRELLTRTDMAAKSQAPVLILGETGVGKELLARRLHKRSSRRLMPLITINLSSIPESLVESELFGHEKGAFTGADQQKLGRVELANKGTLFIDEAGDISKSVQLKLLRTLEEKTFFRVGGTVSVKSDFRLITATNRDLVKEVETGNFREDLYYRLNVVPLIVPPLRERGNDIILIAQYFLAIYAKEFNKPTPELKPEMKAILKAYNWPGNVRELKNVIERAMIFSTGENFEFTIIKGPKKADHDPSDNPFSDLLSMDAMQRRYIEYIHKKTGGKLSGPGSMAEILGMNRSTLQSRMRKLGIS